jgi:hypothetical protein
MTMNYQHGECTMCEKRDYLRPLHDAKGWAALLPDVRRQMAR